MRFIELETNDEIRIDRIYLEYTVSVSDSI